MNRIPSNRAVLSAEETQASGSHQQVSSSSATPVPPSWPNEIEAANQQRALHDEYLNRLYRRMLNEHYSCTNLGLLCVSARDLYSGTLRLTSAQYEQLHSRVQTIRLCCGLEDNVRWRENTWNVCSMELLMMRWIALERATTDDNADPLDPQTVQQFLREKKRIAGLFGIQPTESPRPLCRGSVYARNNQFIRERNAIVASLRCAGANFCQQLVRRARSGRSTLGASLLHSCTKKRKYNSLIWSNYLTRIHGMMSFLCVKQNTYFVLPPDFFEHSPFIQACIQQCLAIEKNLGQYNPYRAHAPTFLELLNERCLIVLQGIILDIQRCHKRRPQEFMGYHSTRHMYTMLCKALFFIEKRQQRTSGPQRMGMLSYYWGGSRPYRLTEEPSTIALAYQQLMQAGPLSGCDEYAPPMQALIEACIAAEGSLFPGSIIPNAKLATVLHHRHRFLYHEHDQAKRDHIREQESGAIQAVPTTYEEKLSFFRAYLLS